MPVNFAFLDSGTGGIPYMLELKKKDPSATCVYLADTVNFPYGTKTAEEVTECAASAVSLIVKKWDPEAIIVACNTVSVTSLAVLRKRFPEIPIIGTVPAIKLAAETSRNHTIGLLATEGTIRHPYTRELERKFASDCTVVECADTDLVSFIEHSLFTATDEDRRNAVQPAVDFFLKAGCDTLILGCTHFIHMAEDIAAASGPAVQVIDSRDGVARQALKVGAASRNKNRQESFFGVITGFLKDQPEDQSLVVTGFNTPSDFSEYRLLCSRCDIPWGGIVQ